MTDPVRLTRRAVEQFAARRRPGYLDAVLAAATDADERIVSIPRAAYDSLRDAYCLVCGPGCHLRRTLEWFGLRDDGTCGCSEMAAKMDAWGDACWDHLEEIVDHLRAAAEKRGLPFIATAARIAVGRAIEAAARERAAPAPTAGEPA